MRETLVGEEYSFLHPQSHTTEDTMPFVSKEMRKVQRAMEKEEEQLKREAALAAWAELRKEEEEHHQLKRQYLYTMESQILSEIDRELQAFMADLDRRLEEKIQRQENETAFQRRYQAVCDRDKCIAVITTTPGAVVIQTEDVIARVHGYKILRHELGRGKIAVIYKAEGPNGQTGLACKMSTISALPPDQINRYLSSMPIQRYLKEHSNSHISPIYDIFQTSDKVYVFTEAACMDMLRKIKMEGPFTESQALHWGKQIAEGLAYLHSIGVAHERIRPGHVLLDANGNAKLAGFGWCVVYYDPCRQEMVKQRGSSTQKYHHFYAPEVMKDDFYFPQMADIWSLGTFIHTMLTKDWPFEKECLFPHDKQWKLSFKRTNVPLSNTVYDILSKCFVEDPVQRADIYDVLCSFPQ